MPITVGTTEDFNALWEFEKKKKLLYCAIGYFFIIIIGFLLWGIPGAIFFAIIGGVITGYIAKKILDERHFIFTDSGYEIR
jgi:hypothetical protein